MLGSFNIQLDWMELGSRGRHPCQLQQEAWPQRCSCPTEKGSLPSAGPQSLHCLSLFHPTSASHAMLAPLPRRHQQLQLQLQCFNVSLCHHGLLSLQLIFSSLPALTILGPHQDLLTIVLSTFLLSLTPALPPVLLPQLRFLGHHCVTPCVHLQLLQPTLPSLYSAGKTLRLL